ncbi:MAG: hypothetical protein LC632_09450, partial [Xanthomonadaceae bacterium]|nr:hypothetical protein [Xanthomonadaceae bacterium]
QFGGANCTAETPTTTATGGDPFQYDSNENTSYLDTAVLVSQLNLSNVLVTTNGSTGTGPNGGSISVVDPVSWSSAFGLELFATTFVSIGAAITNTGTGGFTSSGTNFTSSAAGTISLAGGAVNLNGHTGDITIGADVTTGGGAFTTTGGTSFTSTGFTLNTSNGAGAGGDVTITSSGALAVGAINTGGTTNGGSIGLTGGTVTLSGNLTATGGTGAGGTVAISGPVTLDGAVAITTTGATDGPVSFDSTIDGAQNLTINAGAAAVTLGGAVGSTMPLGILAVNTTGTIGLAGNISTTDAAVTLASGGTLNLTAPVTLSTGTGEVTVGAVTVGGGGQNLSVANSGNATFASINLGTGAFNTGGVTAGTITTTGTFTAGSIGTAAAAYSLVFQGGGSVTGGTATTLTNTGGLSIGASFAFEAGIITSGGPPMTIGGGSTVAITATSGVITLGSVTINDDTTLSLGDGASAVPITLSTVSGVAGNGLSHLVIDTGDATVSLNGTIGTDIGSVSITSARNIVVTGGITTDGAGITMSANQQVTPSSGNFNADVNVTSGTIDITGTGGLSDLNNNNDGVMVSSGTVRATTTGSVTLTGNAVSGATSTAVYISGGTVSVHDAGTLTIAANGEESFGLHLQTGSTIEATGTGSIDIDASIDSLGTAILLDNNTTIAAVSGAITIDITTPSAGSGTGLRATGTTASDITIGSGSITLTISDQLGDSVNIDAHDLVFATTDGGSLLIQPLETDSTVRIGNTGSVTDGDGVLALEYYVFSGIDSDFSSVIVGRADGAHAVEILGTLSVAAPITIRAPAAGGTISRSGGGTPTFSGGVTLTAHGAVTIDLALSAGAAAMVLESTDGAVTGTGILTAANLTVLSADAASLTGANSIGELLNVEIANAAQGFTFVNSAALTVTSVITDGGDVSITASTGNLSLDEAAVATGTGAVTITLESTAGSILDSGDPVGAFNITSEGAIIFIAGTDVGAVGNALEISGTGDIDLNGVVGTSYVTTDTAPNTTISDDTVTANITFGGATLTITGNSDTTVTVEAGGRPGRRCAPHQQ